VHSSPWHDQTLFCQMGSTKTGNYFKSPKDRHALYSSKAWEQRVSPRGIHIFLKASTRCDLPARVNQDLDLSSHPSNTHVHNTRWCTLPRVVTRHCSARGGQPRLGIMLKTRRIDMLCTVPRLGNGECLPEAYTYFWKRVRVVFCQSGPTNIWSFS